MRGGDGDDDSGEAASQGRGAGVGGEGHLQGFSLFFSHVGYRHDSLPSIIIIPPSSLCPSLFISTFFCLSMFFSFFLSSIHTVSPTLLPFFWLTCIICHSSLMSRTCLITFPVPLHPSTLLLVYLSAELMSVVMKSSTPY